MRGAPGGWARPAPGRRRCAWPGDDGRAHPHRGRRHPEHPLPGARGS